MEIMSVFACLLFVVVVFYAFTYTVRWSPLTHLLNVLHYLFSYAVYLVIIGVVVVSVLVVTNTHVKPLDDVLRQFSFTRSLINR